MLPYLAVAGIVFLAGSFATYHPPVRDSVWFWVIYGGSTVIGCLAWGLGSKALADPVKILVFSMYWDALMVLAYYAIPFVLHGNRLTWQMAGAALLTAAGLAWAKYALELPAH